MSKIDSVQWRRLSEHLDHALERSPAEREAWLAQLARDDPALAAELQTLLGLDARAERDGFLDDCIAFPSDLPAQPSLAGQSVGAYTLDALLGEGGMGTVWLAHRSDGRYEGRVAVKLLKLSLVGIAGTARFRREGNILAHLSHAHIARMLDAGVTTNGQPYLVLEHVEGQPIDRYCDERRLDIAGRVRLLLQVLDAVAHAHGHLILHRDLKPANILVSQDGVPKLLDFGIAKVLEDASLPAAETALTRVGGGVFTPEYAAPEQIQGQTATMATDVYALGVLLYLLLRGEHPTPAPTRTPIEQMKAIVDTEPVRLSDLSQTGRDRDGAMAAIAAQRDTTLQRLRRELRGDLENIVAKALKKRPEERYATVRALADDLHRCLAHEPVSARHDSFPYRAGKFVRRHRVAVAAGSMSLMALVAGALGVLWQAHEAQAQRDRALHELQRAEAANGFIAQLLGTMSYDGKPFTTLDLLERGEHAVDKLFEKDPALRAEMLLVLGARYDDAGDWARSASVYEHAAALAREIGAPVIEARANCQLAGARQALFPDRVEMGANATLAVQALAALQAAHADSISEARCLMIRTELDIGDPDQAITRARRVLALTTASGPLYADISVEALGAIGFSLWATGRLAEARPEYDRLFARMQEAGLEDTTPMLRLVVDAGKNFWLGGADLDARHYYERALENRSRERPGDDIHADLALGYGLILADAGQIPESVAWFQHAALAAKASGSSFYEAASLAFLAQSLRVTGDAAEAENALSHAEAIFRPLISDDDPWTATLMLYRAQLAHDRGDSGSARLLLERAVQLWARDGEPHSMSILGETTLSSVLIDLGDLDAAAVHAEQALVLARRIAGDLTASRWMGLALLSIADARTAQGDVAGAGEACTSALAQLESSIGADAPDTQRARSCRQHPEASRE